jgi:hypothetical protein
MDAKYFETNTRLGAYTALGGSVSFIIGAALWIASGVDIDQALASGEMASYLVSAGEVTHLIVANLCFWILGALLLGAASTALANLCVRRQAIAQIALLCYRTGVPLVITAYVAWLALHIQIGPETSPAAVLLAETIGWFASRADWIATVLIIGIGPALFSLAARGDWMPTWLARGGIATAIAGLLTTIAMFTEALTTYGFLIVPVGLVWTIATGIVLLRRGSASAVDIPNLSKKVVS